MRIHLKNLIVMTVTAFIVGCGTPVSKEISVSKAELKKEQQIQAEMQKKYGHKKVVRKHKEVAPYEARLNKFGPALLHSAQKLCRKGEGKCNYKFKVADQDVLNAWADGKTINITPIMMDFLETDTELALVLSHEIAHNIMGHIPKKIQNVIIGAVLDVLAKEAADVDTQGTFTAVGSMAYSQGFENEADYVGIYIMANSGYDISNVNNVWRKMSIQEPSGIKGSFFRSHPANPERYLRLQKAIDEIKDKKAKGQVLMPDKK